MLAKGRVHPSGDDEKVWEKDNDDDENKDRYDYTKGKIPRSMEPPDVPSNEIITPHAIL